MFRELKSILIESSAVFLNTEQNLILSGVSERCLCGAFMLILNQQIQQSRFSNYHTDIEYNRNFDNSIKTIISERQVVLDITCDLIVHSRGQIPDYDNLIALEMKKREGTNVEEDRNRLKALTTPTNGSEELTNDGRLLPRHVCGYVLGVFYQIDEIERRIRIEYYADGTLQDLYEGMF